MKKVPGVYTLTNARTTGVLIKGKTHQFPSATGSFDVPGNAKGYLVLRAEGRALGPEPEERATALPALARGLLRHPEAQGRLWQRQPGPEGSARAAGPTRPA